MNDETIVGYGIGQYYEYVKDKLPFRLSFLCDRRWQEFGEVHGGIPVISPEQLRSMENVRVVIFGGDETVCASIESDLKGCPAACERAWKYLTIPYELLGKDLKKISAEGLYQDQYNNRVYFHKTLSDKVKITFRGSNNVLRIGEKVSAGLLRIDFGNDGVCEVGSGTEFNSVLVSVSGGKVRIGEECLFSNGISIRCHDGHHIFDRETGRRLNYPRDVSIGNHVWVGAGAQLLPGFSIDDNSVIGTGSVSSSGFGSGLIIGGNPARVIREGILWSKDDTNFRQRDSFGECMDRVAEKYFR